MDNLQNVSLSQETHVWVTVKFGICLKKLMSESTVVHRLVDLQMAASSSVRPQQATSKDDYNGGGSISQSGQPTVSTISEDIG